jgi:hypothetical protein
VVQDLVIRRHVVNFRCERWQMPDGSMMTAALPDGIDGHFGPQLRRRPLPLQPVVNFSALVGSLAGNRVTSSKSGRGQPRSREFPFQRATERGQP